MWLLMRMLGLLEIKGGWTYIAKHIAGLRNAPTDCVSRWSPVIRADKDRELTKNDDWSEQDNLRKGKEIFDTVLQKKNILSEHDDCLRDVNERRTSRLIRVREGVKSLDQD